MNTPIVEPHAAPILFNGNMRVFSTCRGCGDIMQVTNPRTLVHPSCTSPDDMLESLVLGWVSCVINGDDKAAAATEAQIAKLESESIDFRSAAIDYASWGWPVFPLRAGCGIDGCTRCTPRNPCGKVPAVPKSKGGQGFKDAKTDVDRIGKWWTKHPRHNIGLATGHAFDVIDIDPKNGGIESFLKLLDSKDLPDCHGIVVTASGGMHFYVLPTGEGNSTNICKGIDYRGKGGYVVAPPSTLGKPECSYSWMTYPSPELKGGKSIGT